MQDGKLPRMQEIRLRLDKYLAGKDFQFNPDAETVDSIIMALSQRHEKYGQDYCPCRMVTGDAEKDGRIVCPCAYHQQEIEEQGHCHCHLFTRR